MAEDKFYQMLFPAVGRRSVGLCDRRRRHVPHGTQAKNGEKSMERKDLNTVLKKVICEAREVKIPVPYHICEEVFINPRPKKRFGCCKKQEDQFLIEISEFVLASSEEAIKGILAHEVLHTCPGCYEHGARWKEYAARMNETYGYRIKRVSTRRELGLPQQEGETEDGKIRYIIKCNRCGREYPRQRYTCIMKKINAYRCNCGGKLTVIKVEEES